jgi:hypothetical protein
MPKEKYDRILYVKKGIYSFERFEGSSISNIRSAEIRKIIIDGLEDPNVVIVKYDYKTCNIHYYNSNLNRIKIFYLRKR